MLLLCVTLADKQCTVNSTAASLAITLQLVTGTFTVTVEVQRGRIQTSTKAKQVWIVLPSAALSQAACQIRRGLRYNYIPSLLYYYPIPSSGLLAPVGDPTRNT